MRDDLLATEHPVGRFKTRVFGAAGYDRNERRRLRDDLRALAAFVEVLPGSMDQYGQRRAGVNAKEL